MIFYIKSKKIFYLLTWLLCLLLPSLIVSYFSFLEVSNSGMTDFFRQVSILYDYISICIPFVLLALISTFRIAKIEISNNRSEYLLAQFEFITSLLLLFLFCLIIWNKVFFGGGEQERLWGRTFAIFIVPVFGSILVLIIMNIRKFLQMFGLSKR